MDGYTLSTGITWKQEIGTDNLYQDYCDISEKIGIKRRVTPTAFGKQLKKLIPECKREKKQVQKIRSWVYLIPSLQECRRLFDQITQSDHNWPADD